MKTPEFNFPDPSPESEGGKKCLFCGWNKLITGVRVLDRTYGDESAISVGKDREPTAMIFKGRERSGTTALVCEKCGYVHLFATNPAILRYV